MKQNAIQGHLGRLLLIVFLTLLIFCPTRSWSADTNTLATTFEAIAQTNRHFSLAVMIDNRPLGPRHGRNDQETSLYSAAAQDQLVLLKHLRQASEKREALVTLLKHENPKVRTLALGALFQREDGRDLPLIASCGEDFSPTFPDLTDETGSSYNFSSLSGLERPQTVAQVSRSMLLLWRDRSSGHESTAARFRVRLERATRRIEPLPAGYQADVDRVLADLNALPVSERAWTALYIQALDAWYVGVVDVSEIAQTALKALSPAEIARFLLHDKVTDDPELRPATDSPRGIDFARRHHDSANVRWRGPLPPNTDVFYGMAYFILQHAGALLRPQDAPILLANEKKDSTRLAVWWSAAAAELVHRQDPDQAAKIITEALQRYPLMNASSASQQAVLFAAVWRMEGIKAQPRLIDWFYAAQRAINQRYEGNHATVEFLKQVETAKRTDTPQLLSALVTDKRFVHTDRQVLVSLLNTANRNLAKPLESQDALWNYETTSATLDRWRELLRDHFSSTAKKPAQ